MQRNEINKYVVSEPYGVTVDSIKYDTKVSAFNPPKPIEEYTSLVAQIQMQGQTTPAYMRNGLLGDGVHRAKACKELGLQLLVVDIDPRLPDDEYILLCNQNTFTARNDSATQKAIKALHLVEEFGYTDSKAAKLTALKDRRAIGYARTVQSSNIGKELNVLAVLLSGKEVNIRGRFTKSIETAKKIIAKIEEEDSYGDVETALEDAEVFIDYNEHLHTEHAREKFWSISGMSNQSQKLELIAVLNTLYGRKDA